MQMQDAVSKPKLEGNRDIERTPPSSPPLSPKRFASSSEKIQPSVLSKVEC